jgi:hypothetical protein
MMGAGCKIPFNPEWARLPAPVIVTIDFLALMETG